MVKRLNLNSAQVKAILEASANDVGKAGKDPFMDMAE
jgi:hypothetical protein